MSANRNWFAVAALSAAISIAAFPALAKDADALSKESIQAALDSAYAQFKDLKEGKNADYIPALAKVDPNIYGVALVTTDGRVYTKGDVASEVSIQSISKVFTMAKVIEEQGPEAIANNKVDSFVQATKQQINRHIDEANFEHLRTRAPARVLELYLASMHFGDPPEVNVEIPIDLQLTSCGFANAC